MAWIEKLHATYEACKGREPPGAEPLMPISHGTQKANIEIVVAGSGGFRRARVLEPSAATTLIPCTEASGGRSGVRPKNHPLCDKLQYVAGDFLAYGGKVTGSPDDPKKEPKGFACDPEKPYRDYICDLDAWHNASGHPKLAAIKAYVEEGRVIRDLIAAGILPTTADGKLLREWSGDKSEAPAIFKSLSNDQTADDAFVRWVVEDGVSLATGTWEDESLIDAWISYYRVQQTLHGLCMVTGQDSTLAEQHPAKLRNDGDRAKLISSNDTSGYTFRGRFFDADEACGIGYVVTQMAHTALRWLVRRQGYKAGTEAFVAWAVAGKPIPDPCADSLSMMLGIESTTAKDSGESEVLIGDVGQAFARRLNRAIAGYGAKLDPTDDIVVMGVDSATKTSGRMAITYYRELKGSEFLERIEAWHSACAWPQNFGKDKSGKVWRFTGVPAPHDIAEAAFGRRLDEKLKKATVERLLPCIVDGRPVPRDLMVSTVRRASNRVGLEHWEWEKVLGIACGLFRGWSKSERKEEYAMALEEDRTSRDYLYGRLLAVADNLERFALTAAEKNRDTMAGRLMQRFAERPFSTWRTIELALTPYKTRLRASDKSAGFLWSREKLIDEIQCRFTSADFSNDSQLSGEFLLGYHCQRAALFAGSSTQTTDQSTSEDSAS